jgi:hypothetical protein
MHRKAVFLGFRLCRILGLTTAGSLGMIDVGLAGCIEAFERLFGRGQIIEVMPAFAASSRFAHENYVPICIVNSISQLKDRCTVRPCM